MRLYEAHIPVSDLTQSIAFYRDVVGLTLAFEQPHRNVAFLYVGDAQSGMLGLWGPDSGYGWKNGQRFKSHFAIGVGLDVLLATPARLQALGIETRSFDGKSTDEPSVIGWMPSAQIYFSDPDGHSAEFITVLTDPPDPDFFGSWTDWVNRNK